MKRFLLLIMSAILACMAFIGCNKGEGATNGYVPKKYNIEYQAVNEAGQLIDIPELMKVNGGDYPVKYTERAGAEISGLRNVRKDAETVYIFEGWYYDQAMNNIVANNTISKSKTGDLTLYAKISEQEQAQGVISTISYKWNDFGTEKDGVLSMPAAMVEGIEFPYEYEEGVGTELPRLKTWKQSEKVTYEFEGWYYDANFEHKVENNVIPTTEEGILVLYAAIAIWVG
jgi:uncharacterized repeat protein (TIGR02543 family)